MLHVRNGILGGWTGRYIQALLNTGDGSFTDETPTWIRRQRGTAIPGQNYGGLVMHDVDLDGCQDLVVTAPVDRIRPQSPLVYRNNGSGQFSPVTPTAFRPGPGRALRLGGDAHRRERRRGDRLLGVGNSVPDGTASGRPPMTRPGW